MENQFDIIIKKINEGKEVKLTPIQSIIHYFFKLKGGSYYDENGKVTPKNKILFARFTKPAKELLILCDNDLTKSLNYIKIIYDGATAKKLDGTLETVIKRGNDFKIIEDKLEPYSTTLDYFHEQNELFNKRYGKYLS